MKTISRERAITKDVVVTNELMLTSISIRQICRFGKKNQVPHDFPLSSIFYRQILNMAEPEL